MSNFLSKEFFSKRLKKPPEIVAPALWLATSFAAGIVVSSPLAISSNIASLIAFLSVLLVILSSGAEEKWKNIAIIFVFFSLGAARFGIFQSILENHWSKVQNISAV